MNIFRLNRCFRAVPRAAEISTRKEVTVTETYFEARQKARMVNRGQQMKVTAAEKARKSRHKFRTGSVWNLLFRMFRK